MGVFGEEIHNALHRLVRIVGMQCGNTQVAGLGIVQRVLHGGPVADFANHDHIRRFPHRATQGLVIGQRIEPHLALCHE